MTRPMTRPGQHERHEPRGRVCPLSVAPMMDRTDRHFRSLVRRITRRTLLYTEMVTAPAILHGDRERLLGFDDEERPLALQLGGDDPAELAACARIAADSGYDEIDLNVGCPSDRVQRGRFGACLMTEPDRVADAVTAMRAAVDLPVTVKHRLGVDDRDSFEDLAAFVDRVARAGCDRFIVHARKAWLTGLSPKENRSVPPLRYGEVHRLKRERPELRVEINGGFTTLDRAAEQLGRVDGVMIGRAAYENPYLLADADARFYDDPHPVPSQREVVESLFPYVERRLSEGVFLSRITRHLLGLFAGLPGARAWRRILTVESTRPGAGLEVLRQALAALPERTLDPAPRGGAD